MVGHRLSCLSLPLSAEAIHNGGTFPASAFSLGKIPPQELTHRSCP